MAFWDFLKDANTEKKVAGKVFNFLSQPDAVNKVALAGRDLAVGAARGGARVPETVARSSVQTGFDIARKVNPNVPQLKADVGGATDPIRRTLYGSEGVETYQTRTAGNKKVLEQSRFRDQAVPLSFLGLGLTVGSDITPNPVKGAAKGAAQKVAKAGTDESLQKLAKASTEQEVRSIMKETPPEIVDKVAPAISQTKDPHIITNIIKNASHAPPPQASLSDEILNKYKGSASTPDEQRALDYVVKNPEKVMADYDQRVMQEFGTTKPNIVAGDEAKFVIPGFGPEMSSHYHEPASAVAKVKLDRLLADPATKDSPVLLMAGGSGSGKTSGLQGLLKDKGQSLDDFAAVIDTNSNVLSSAETKIQQALQSGRKVDMVYVYRDPVVAFKQGVIPRAKRIGRIVPISAHLDTHFGSNQVVHQLAEKYKDNPNVQILGINNSGSTSAGATATSVDQLPKLSYNRDRLRKTLEQAVINEHKQGNVSKQELETYLGRKATPETVDRGDISSKPAPQKSEGLTPPGSPFKDITDAINGRPVAKGQTPVKGIKSVSAANKTLLSKERGQRFAASKSAGDTAEGSQGYYKELSQLKGEYSKTKLGGMIENLGPQKAEELFSQARKQIQSVPDSVYDDLGYFPQSARLNTQTAIRKVIFGENGGVPTASELKLIKLVDPSLADDIASKIPKDRKFFDLAAKLAGLPRALQSSLDLSMGGRQGLLVAARHPVQWARANKESVKYLKSDKYYQEQMVAIRKAPEYKLGKKYGLATPAAGGTNEEAYAASELASKIPVVGRGVDASQRAYEGGLAKLRSDLWAHTLKSYGGVEGAEETLGAKGMQDLAEAINTLTGRGGKKGGLISKHVQTLSTTLFAPRLWAARLNTLNPAYYARLSPAARKVALENAGAFAAVASVVLGATAALGADIETDPRSSDFLKIKFGDTRYDIFGGLQQNIVFAWRQITGEKKNSQTGDVTKLGEGYGAPTRLTVASDMFTNKLAPVPAFLGRALEGKDRGGQPLNYATLNPFENEIAKLFQPINLQGIYETSKSTGSVPQGVARNVPNFFGIGTQTYGIQDMNLSDKQKGYIQKLTDDGAPPDQIKASTLFYQTLKAAPSREGASEEVNKALAAGDTQKAIEIAKAYNQKYAAVFKDWSKQYGKYGEDEQLFKDYSAQKIRLTNSLIKRRLQTIKDNPVKYGG